MKERDNNKLRLRVRLHVASAIYDLLIIRTEIYSLDFLMHELSSFSMRENIIVIFDIPFFIKLSYISFGKFEKFSINILEFPQYRVSLKSYIMISIVRI